MRSFALQITFFAVILIGERVLAAPSSSEEVTEADGATTYTKNGTSYSVRHVFQSSCSTEDLLAVCFEFKHLQKFYQESIVRLVESGPDWQKVEYRTDYVICSSTAVYMKTLIRPQKKVSFTLLSCRVSGLGIPSMTASSGDYTVTDDGKTRTLTYAQSVTLDRVISALDWPLIKRKTKIFFGDFEEYVRQQAPFSTQQKSTPVDKKADSSAKKLEPSTPKPTSPDKNK